MSLSQQFGRKRCVKRKGDEFERLATGTVMISGDYQS